MTKKILLFFSFMALLFFTFKASTANALTISQMCLTMVATVNVPPNLPSGDSVYVGCNGDGGYPPRSGFSTKTDPNHYGVCLGSCDGTCDLSAIGASSAYKGPLDWCKGDIQPVINGQATLTHCSCPPYADGCIKTFITSSTPSMVNACGSRPTVPTGSDNRCTITGGACGVNRTTIRPTVNINCPVQKADVTIKVYVDNDNSNTISTGDPLYTGSFGGTNNGTAYNGTGGTTTISNVPLGAATANLNTITGYNIVTVSPLANPVSYTVTPTGTVVNFLIQAPRCVPATTCGANQVCGSIPDGCGGQVTCGTCTSPTTCNENAHTCTCTPITSCGANQVCGSIPNGCGGTVTCGTCDAAKGETCNNNTCSCPTGQTPTHLACGTNHTCQVVNTCGVNSCTEGQNCGPATTLSFVIGLDGIGTTGDQRNPAYLPVTGQPLSGSTISPVHTTRPVKVFLTDSAQHTQQFQGNVVYDPTATDQNYGKFATITPIDLGVHIQAGTYTVYVTVDYSHLTKSLGTVTIALGQDNPVNGGRNAGNLVAGDIVGASSNTADNVLTIEDYNVLISCTSYSVDHSLCNSNSAFPKLSDLDDNGDDTTARAPLVNQFDYNLWLREFAQTPNGDTPPGITTAVSAHVQTTITVVSAVETSTSSAATTIEQPATQTQTGTSSSPAAATTIEQPATQTQTGTTNATASGQ